DRREVLFLGCLESNLDMIVPGLGHKADGVRLRFEQCCKTWIVGCRTSRPARHAKGRESRAKPAIRAEEFGVGGIGARIAAFDVVDAQVVQHRSYCKLVREGEVD